MRDSLELWLELEQPRLRLALVVLIRQRPIFVCSSPFPMGATRHDNALIGFGVVA